MGSVRNKIRSNSGASILMGLAVVLVCTTVAAVVLLAAATNVGKSESAAARNASYYAVASAVQLLSDDMARQAPFAEVSTRTVTYACQEVHPSYVHEDAGVPSPPQVDFGRKPVEDSPLVQLVEEAVYAIDSTDPSSMHSANFTIQAPELDPVEARFIMDYRYNIRIELESAGEAGGYAMLLEIPAVLGTPVETTQSEAVDSHMDGWEYYSESASLPWKTETTLNLSSGNYEPAENEFGHSVATLYELTTTTTTTPISWGSASVSKGVA